MEVNTVKCIDFYHCNFKVILHKSFILICSTGSLALLGAQGGSKWSLHSAYEQNSDGLDIVTPGVLHQSTLTGYEVGILKIWKLII